MHYDPRSTNQPIFQLSARLRAWYPAHTHAVVKADVRRHEATGRVLVFLDLVQPSNPCTQPEPACAGATTAEKCEEAKP